MNKPENAAELAAGLAPTPSYRYGEVVGDHLFVAGQVPLDGQGELIDPDQPGPQARRCLDNLRTLVGVHGFDLGDVRHLTVHVVGPHQNLLDAWAVVTDWWDDDVPPATLLGAHLLGYEHQVVEIDARILRAQNR